METFNQDNTSNKVQLAFLKETPKYTLETENPVADTLYWIYFSIGIVGIINNGVVVIVFLASQHLRRRSANIIIINQCLIDGLASLFLVLVMIPYSGTTNSVVCKLWLSRLPVWSLLVASTYNILCLALDRHLAFMYPLWHKFFFTKSKMIPLLLFPWLFGIVFNTSFVIPTTILINGTCETQWPSETFKRAFGVILVHIEYIIPILLQIYLYGRIIYILRRRSRGRTIAPISGNSSHGNQRTPRINAHNDLSWSRAQRNSLKIAAMVSICFVLCWTCDQVYYLMYFFQKDGYYDVELFSYLLLPVVANSCINPFIYALQYESFQGAVHRLCCRKSGPKHHSTALTERISKIKNTSLFTHTQRTANP